MAERNRTPVQWFEGGPLHGRQQDKNILGRWRVYLDERGEPLSTRDGDARARARVDGKSVTFYKLDPTEQHRDGRFGRVYVFCTLLEQRARELLRQQDAAAAAVTASVTGTPTGP